MWRILWHFEKSYFEVICSTLVPSKKKQNKNGFYTLIHGHLEFKELLLISVNPIIPQW